MIIKTCCFILVNRSLKIFMNKKIYLIFSNEFSSIKILCHFFFFCFNYKISSFFYFEPRNFFKNFSKNI